MFTHANSKNGPFRGRTLRFRTDDSPKHGDPANRDHAGFAALNDDAVVANAALESGMVPRNVGRSRGAECGLCLVSIRFVPMSRSVRDVVRFFNGFRVVGHVISVFVPHQRWMSELQSRQVVRSLVFASDSKQRTSKTAAPPSPSKRRLSIDL